MASRSIISCMAVLVLTGCPVPKDTGPEGPPPTTTPEECDPAYVDADNDGFGGEASDPCDPSAVTTPGDCDDGDPAIHPAASETCNGVDDDCDGDIDEGNPLSTWYVDLDGDSYGADPVEACAQPDDTTIRDGDCDDSDYTINPGATEVCDDLDNDCDGEIDEDLIGTWYPDTDFDGWGDDAGAIETCDPPKGYVTTGGDCDDTSAGARPGGGLDTCDGLDNDCDGDIDEDHKPGWMLITVGDSIYGINPMTAETYPVAPVTGASNINTSDVSDLGFAVAHAADQLSLYGLFGCSGKLTEIGPTGAEDMGGIAFGPGGLLYGLEYVNDRLVSINVATGVATQIGPIGWDVDYCGMAWDCARDILWAVDSRTGWLFEIDPVTGLGSGFIPLGLDFEVVGLEYDPQSQWLFASTGSDLYRIDPMGGDVHHVGSFDIERVNDLAWHPVCP